ncbi:MAG: toxin co-regulated pilus biosynthesis Q family protein [Alphaproteobacteria bacterium]|nr:toxin co-regulated pilus biosynthesis Q family protein [Alphaproteobacteria bacterium]MBL0718045.1 toxin co-regulated pilus biosynthesis Q family protein [Alphaproteobacteria bacterium]
MSVFYRVSLCFIMTLIYANIVVSKPPIWPDDNSQRPRSINNNINKFAVIDKTSNDLSKNAKGKFAGGAPSATHNSKAKNFKPQYVGNLVTISAQDQSNTTQILSASIAEDTVEYNEYRREDIIDLKSFTGNSNVSKIDVWIVNEGSTLHQVLVDWASRTGWEVIWRSAYEYPIMASAVFEGKFEDVSAALVRNFARAYPSPYGRFFYGNKVLLIYNSGGDNEL